MLHVVVGHGLPRYFMNAIRSVRTVAPDDPVLIIDNASPDARFRIALEKMATDDPLVEVILRPVNELVNRKVGGLYEAYALAFEHAVTRGFDLLHLIQGDFQTMWWDGELVERTRELFAVHPDCVNIQMQFLSRDRALTDDLAETGGGLTRLKHYGLTDTGLYHLGRWMSLGMRFGPAEQGHARRYLDQGLQVLCHPWPTDVPIPWPPVIRNGRQRGREVATDKPFLLKPLPPTALAALKDAKARPWLEEVCVPWGWACATPMWVSGLDGIDYWVLRYRDAKANGPSRLLPRPDLRGVDRRDRFAMLREHRWRPPVSDLLVGAVVREVVRRRRAHHG